MAASAFGVSAYVMNAVPRLVMTSLMSLDFLQGTQILHLGFIGSSKARIGPYVAKISWR